MIRAWISMGVACVPLLLPSACDPNNTNDCDCTDPAAHIHVTAESAAAVASIELSGPACSGESAACDQLSATGCETYSFTAHAAGSCTVNVIFAPSAGGGTFMSNVNFAALNTCCTGFYADPESAGDIEASRPTDDAGSTG